MARDDFSNRPGKFVERRIEDGSSFEALKFVARKRSLHLDLAKPGSIIRGQRIGIE
jgi:hypothetical protein